MRTTDKPTLKLHEQRFMVSPCGFDSGFVPVAEIAIKAPGWFDCTAAGLTDAEIGQLMERRMWATSLQKAA